MAFLSAKLLFRMNLPNLQICDNGSVLPPAIYAATSSDFQSEESKLLLLMINSEITPLDYSLRVRKHMSGKKGHIRYNCLGVSPPSSMRGVATSVWTKHYHHVYVPEQWVRLPCTVTRECDNTTSNKSAIFTKVEFQQGSWWLLNRPPSISNGSVRAVQVFTWKHPSIGVSPEFCKDLNLDYDGDEVHIIKFSDQASINELMIFHSRTSINQVFSTSNIVSAVSSINCNHTFHNIQLHEESGIDDCDDDFMIYSTRSFTQMCNGNLYSFNEYDKLCNTKESAWTKMRTTYSGKSRDASVYMNDSINSISQLVESHLTVSDGFTFARQLKHLAMNTTVSNGKLECALSRHRRIDVSYSHQSTLRNNCNRIDALMLSMKVSTRIMQSLLDRAKGKGSTSGSSFIIGLLSNKPIITYGLYDSDSHHAQCYRLTNDRTLLAKIADPAVRMKECIKSVTYGCNAAGIEHTPTETIHLAYLVCSTLDALESTPLTDIMSTRYISNSNVDVLSAACCDDISSIDRNNVKLSATDNRRYTSSSTMLGAILTGNFTSIIG